MVTRFGEGGFAIGDDKRVTSFGIQPGDGGRRGDDGAARRHRFEDFEARAAAHAQRRDVDLRGVQKGLHLRNPARDLDVIVFAERLQAGMRLLPDDVEARIGTLGANPGQN